MNILIVGAGAVGQVLGAHLQHGGARVSYLVKPEHTAQLARGLTLRSLRGAPPIKTREPELLSARGAAPGNSAAGGRPAGAAQPDLLRDWDVVILSVSSPALRRGNWLEELAAMGDATIMGIQPGLDDREFVARRFGVERVVWGMFAIMAWATDDGVAYYRPPFGALPLSGPRKRVQPLIDAFRRGGLPARMHPDVPRALAFGGALLDLHMVALECARFQFSTLSGDRPLIADAHMAIGEALAVAAHVRGGRPPFALRLVRPWMTRLLLRVLPRLVPFDLEQYLRRHYTKVADQTIAGLRQYITLAEREQLPHRALDRMLERLTLSRGQDLTRTVTVGGNATGVPEAARDRPRA